MMLTTSSNQGTANIYQFPTGGRSALGGRRYETKVATPRVNETISSGSWYHEAAIQDSKPERDR